MEMANVNWMVLAHAPMGSMEILVQVYLYHLGWFWASLAVQSSRISWGFLSIILLRIIHQAKKKDFNT